MSTEWSFEKSAAGLRVCRGGAVVLELPTAPLEALDTTMAPEHHNGSVLLHRRVRRRLSGGADWALEQRENGALLRGALEDGTPWQLELQAENGALSFAARTSGHSELALRLAAAPDEAVYGFGEQFSHFDMSGHAFSLCVSEQGIGRGAQPVSFLVNLASKGSAGNAFTTYAPMPLFVTSRCRAVLCEENSIYHFDVKKRVPGQILCEVLGQTLHGKVFLEASPLEVLERHTAVSGRLRPLPDWTYGAVLGIRGGKQNATRVLEECLTHGAPVKALWIEDWEGRRGKNGGPPLWWRWYPDETLYPDFKRWAEELRARGIALLGYANPFLSADEGNPLYVEGRARRYFVQDADGTEMLSHFFSSREYTYVCVDLTNPEAYAWLKEKMRIGMLENGLSGWMADYGEYVPLNARCAQPDPVRAHCELPVLWAKLNSELIDETGNRGRALTFHRSAGMGSNRWATAYWAGDQNPTFDAKDGLLSSVNALLTSGLCGMSVNHTDIGGFTTLITPIYSLVRKKEVMLRWLEYAAFTPVFRTHDGNYSSAKNYQFYFDEDGYRQYARMARVHENLGFYFQKLQTEAVERGWPMVRALWLHYPDDAVCRTLNRQYLLGKDVLVAPVAACGAQSVRAYVPAGEWRCPYTGAAVASGWQELPAPLGRPAVLVRANAPLAKALCEAIRTGVQA